MENVNGKLRSPDTQRLEKLIERFEEEATRRGSMSDAIAEMDLTENDAKFLVDSAKWICEFLNSRKIYHKRQQRKRAEFEKIARQLLGRDEVAAIDARVRSMTEAELLKALDEAEEV